MQGDRQEGTFECTICGPLFFANKWNYECHLKTQRHLTKAGLQSDRESVPRFTCADCGHQFSRNASLQRHVREVHLKSTLPLPICEICSKVFSNHSNLARHRHLHKVEESAPTQQAETLSPIHIEKTVSSRDISGHSCCHPADGVPIATHSSHPINMPIQNSEDPLPNVKHCVSVFFPSLADDTGKFADNQDRCSVLERHGFALVTLACCLKLAIGESGCLRVIACELLSFSLLAECAELLGFAPDWANIVPHVRHFSDLAGLKAALNVSTFVQSPFSLHSLFLIGHGDTERIRVNYGQNKALLKIGPIVDLIHRCNPHQIHIMTCKSKKLASNAQRRCNTRGLCMSSIWCSYGDDDVTTVPFDFGSPLDASTDWLTFPLDEDFDTATHTHITASVQAFLCSLSVAYDHNLDELVRSVEVPIHYRAGLSLCPGHISHPSSTNGDLNKLYPNRVKLVPVLARVGLSWAKYRWWLRKLEQTPRQDLEFRE